MNVSVHLRSCFFCICILKITVPAGDGPFFAGKIYDVSGSVVRNATICLYQSEYQNKNFKKRDFPRGASCCRKSDRSGAYSMHIPDHSNYMLIARKKNVWTTRIIAPLTHLTDEDTLFSTDTLKPSGSLTFSVHAEGSNDHRAYLSLNGTPFMFATDTSGTMTVNDIPAGAYKAVIQSLKHGYHTVQCTIRIQSGISEQLPRTLLIPKEQIAHVPKKIVTIGGSSDTDHTSKHSSSKKTLRKATPTDIKKDTIGAHTPNKTKQAVRSTAVSPPSMHQKNQFPPQVSAPSDTLIGIFESLVLTGSAQDNGSITSLEWDIGGTGKYVISPKGIIELQPFKTVIKRFPCILKATDNNGLTATDTTYVWVGLLWMSISPPKELLGRQGHSFLTFNDELFIIGGTRSDVWSSKDGVHWTMLTKNAPFGPVFGHATVVFNNRLWVIGGKTASDTYNKWIWSSSTGVSWKNEGKLPFSNRHYHSATVFRGKIVVIGGMTNSEHTPFLNDIWTSDNGTSWIKGSKAPFSSRYGHGCAVFNKSLYLLGGFSDAIGTSAQYTDVWRSSDGNTWKQISEKAPFSGNTFHSITIFDNKLWSIGGYYRKDNVDQFADILFTADSQNWVNLTSDKTSDGRFFCASVSFNNKIYVSPSDSHKLWIIR